MRLVYFWVVFLPILLRLGSLSQEKGDRKVSLFLMWLTGLEEGGTANGGAKNMPATCFLARGRVHGTLTAAGRAVGSVSYGSQPTSGNIVISVSTGENANRVLSPAPNSRPLLIQFVSVRVGFLFNCDCLLDISYVIIKT